MAWDGSGNFTRTDGTRTGSTTWDQARQAAVTINSPDHDSHDQDIADGLENCLTRDGQNSPSADLPMGGNKHTGVGDAGASNEYATFGQLSSMATPFVAAGSVGGTANAITLTPTVAITSYTAGSGFSFFVETANTGAVTIAVSGLSAVSVRRSNGDALASGDFSAGRHVTVIYDGTNFRSDVDAPPAQVTPSEGITGEIRMYGGSTAPTNWLLCDGSLVSRTTYANLFAVIGESFGAGDGGTTFQLPDPRGRAVIGAGDGTGLTSRSVGDEGGSETHTLTTAQMPSHSHSISTRGEGAGSGGTTVSNTSAASDSTASTSSAGGGAAHNNMQPFLAINHIIRT